MSGKLLTFAAIGAAIRHLPDKGCRGQSWIAFASSAAGGFNGTIPISGAKNATLPLMIASLLTDETLTLDNVPRLADVALLQRILGNHGVDIMVGGKRAGETADDGQTLHISAANIVDTTAPYELVSRMRASFWVLAPLVARMGQARVSLPGGCAIGTRPVDLLIMAMERLGAQHRDRCRLCRGERAARAQGRRDRLPQSHRRRHPHRIMAASLANGTTVIENAAREPEIADVADCLNKMGARISGAGTGADRRRGRRQAAQRPPQRAARPHRDRHLCHGRRHGRRRYPVAECAPGIAASRARRGSSDRGDSHADQPGHPHRPQRRSSGAGRGDDGALPGLSRPTCRRSSWR